MCQVQSLQGRHFESRASNTRYSLLMDSRSDNLGFASALSAATDVELDWEIHILYIGRVIDQDSKVNIAP